MVGHFNTNFSVATPDDHPMKSTDGIERYYPYTLESAGRTDFYPGWTSTIAPKRKTASKLDMLKKNVQSLEENLQQLGGDATEDKTSEESAA